MTNAKIPSFFPDVKTSKAILDLLKWDKIKAQGPNDKINCVARMTYNQNVYWAVNGTNPQEGKNIESFWNILKVLPDNPKIVRLINTTTTVNSTGYDPKVYILLSLNNWKLIKYTDYNSKQPKPYKSRYFSCCERKLIEVVNDPKNETFTIEVVMLPCDYCIAAKEYLRNPNFQIKPISAWMLEAYNDFKHLGLIK